MYAYERRKQIYKIDKERKRERDLILRFWEIERKEEWERREQTDKAKADTPKTIVI